MAKKIKDKNKNKKIKGEKNGSKNSGIPAQPIAENRYGA
jgi:hypothetical protein